MKTIRDSPPLALVLHPQYIRMPTGLQRSFGDQDRPGGTWGWHHVIGFQLLIPSPFQTEEQGQSGSKEDDRPDGHAYANDNASLSLLVILGFGGCLVD